MKKAVAISFLLLANMIVLVHAVIPHHHHNQLPVSFDIVQHEHGDATHEHFPHNHDTQHPVPHGDNSHGHKVFEECILNQAYLKIGNDKQVAQLHNLDFTLLSCLLTPFSDSLTAVAGLEGLPFRQNPYLLSYHTEFISQSLGLRAPPVC
ncbi:DUF6769 family protein [Proteiniphilum saccharofermentans]|uniref:DUF6769 family protein n=1 Tax=Proteiniphilum saccharofermentans TaxID=1642647 RepID=UPI0028AC2661|nr:DUF6769 family protein [Proteiniphilum saccharofermentans]